MADGENLTALSGFVLLGFSGAPELQTTVFTILLSLYVLVLLGNLTMLLLINADPQLHTPMYFFLTHLSFIDFCLSTTIVPKALETFPMGRSHISFWGCFAQMCFFVALAICECFVLGVMAYDRYVAVCKALLYATAMNRARSYGTMVLVYTTGFPSPLLHTGLARTSSFCRVGSANHFFCHPPALPKLSCSSTHVNEILQVSNAGLNTLGSALVVLVSYTCILRTILQIPLARGRLKAFSTCASHLVAITIFCMPGTLVYVQPRKASSQDQAKLVSARYTVLIPALSPLICSLRKLWVRKLVPHLPRL